MVYLLKCRFYPQFVEMSQTQLSRNVFNSLLYAALEFISFLALGFVMKRRLGISTTRQLTFVLNNQWTLVQSTFSLWVVYVVQMYLYHSGTCISLLF